MFNHMRETLAKEANSLLVVGGGASALFLCGGAYCAAYELDKQPFRAVVDTGSPFMLVDGTCGTGDASRWGCYRGNGRDADAVYKAGAQDIMDAGHGASPRSGGPPPTSPLPPLLSLLPLTA